MENENELKIKAIFNSLNDDGVVPHPYLKTRILADSRELINAKKKVFLWKLSSSFFMVAFSITLFLNIIKPPSNPVAPHRPYVIHMNFTNEETAVIAAAEIELPQGVSFHSQKNPQIREARKLRLPIQIASDGRTKLPFVVVAKKEGQMKIQIRLLDKKNNVIKEDDITVNFNQRS